MRHIRPLLCVLALASSFGVAQATVIITNIPVVNGDFQTSNTLTTTDQTGSYNNGSIPNWTITGNGSGGSFEPASYTYDGFSNTGNIVGYTVGTALASQTVGTTVTAGDIYTLTVDLGYRNDQGYSSTADLLVNNVEYFATGTPMKGTFQEFTAVYVGTAADAGHSIAIQLGSAGGQGDFDNASLTQSSLAPEPSSLALLGSGILGLGGLVRRKMAKN